MAIIPSHAGQNTSRQGAPSQGISQQHAPSRHDSRVPLPGRVSVLALSAAFRLLCMLPLLLAVWLAVAWALTD